MTDVPSAADHRRALERLAIEYQEMMRIRAELDGRALGFLVDALVAAVVPHLVGLGVPESKIAKLLRVRLESRAAFAKQCNSVAEILRNFDAIADADPQLANRLVTQFAEVGRFVQAERKTPFAMPEGMQ